MKESCTEGIYVHELDKHYFPQSLVSYEFKIKTKPKINLEVSTHYITVDFKS